MDRVMPDRLSGTLPGIQLVGVVGSTDDRPA
jgi:hypothetical protein